MFMLKAREVRIKWIRTFELGKTESANAAASHGSERISSRRSASQLPEYRPLLSSHGSSEHARQSQESGLVRHRLPVDR